MPLKLPVDAALAASPNETVQHLRDAVKRLYSPIRPQIHNRLIVAESLLFDFVIPR